MRVNDVENLLKYRNMEIDISKFYFILFVNIYFSIMDENIVLMSHFYSRVLFLSLTLTCLTSKVYFFIALVLQSIASRLFIDREL